MSVLTILLLTIIPPPEPVRERVDVIEVNHFYDEQGRLVFDQLIFWDWCEAQDRHEVIAWRMLKCPSQLPEFDWDRGGHVARWLDGEVFREVRAQSVRETWTQYDPELEELALLPRERRRELLIPRR
jgi:hypothetical protein